MNINDMIKDELEFCEEIDCVKNQHNQFIYNSTDGVSSFNLPYILLEYKEWIISNKKL